MADAVSAKTLETFWRMLARGFCAGEKLGAVLMSIAQEMDGTRLGDVANDLLSQVESGRPLSQAMRRHPDVFREHVLLLVEGGEKAGILDRVLLLILEHAWRCPECILGQST